jgi:hypothetical protein
MIALTQYVNMTVYRKSDVIYAEAWEAVNHTAAAHLAITQHHRGVHFGLGSQHRKFSHLYRSDVVRTEPEENPIKWPVIGQSDVPDVCRMICEAIVELERAFEAGELTSRLTSERYEQLLGPQLYGTYEKLADSFPGPLHHLRVNAVQALLATLQNDLLPQQFARARVLVAPEGDIQADDDMQSASPILRFHPVEAALESAPAAILRLDQMLGAGFWRIGFKFESHDLSDAFAQLLVRSAVGRLAGGIYGVHKALERLGDRNLTKELRIVPFPDERRFERLMLDILNEDECRASSARLAEDFHEKTDFRVKYPELQRRNGARVQVTLIADAERHESKMQLIKRIDEFVFLSPLSLAEFVHTLSVRETTEAKQAAENFDIATVWNCFQSKPVSVPDLALELRLTLIRAFNEMPTSPLGPMAQVPTPIRRLFF